MTQTTTTAKALTIPPAGLRFETATTVVTAQYVNGAGWKIQVRINGEHQADLGGLYANVDGAQGALAAYHALVERYTVKLPAAAKGAQTRVSDPQHVALAVAALNGRVGRGGKPGEFNVRVLTALARRGYLELTYQEGRSDSRQVVTGGTLTSPGRIRLDQLTADERAEAEKAARLAVIDSIQIAA